MASARDIIRRLQKLQNFSVRAGVMGGGMYIDTHESVAQVAQWNEYGTSNHPPRPFLRLTVSKNRNKWLNGFSKLLQAYIDGRCELDLVGDKMGVVMQTDILDTIDKGVPPPNSPATIERKLKRGTANPTTLVDSGFMRDSISYDYET